MSARCGLELVAIADAAPDNWTFLEKLRPDERAVDFFHACEHLSEVSDHRVASNWYEKYRAVLRDDVDGVDKVGDPLSPRQGDDGTGARGSQARTRVFPQASAAHALREPQGLHAPASSANKVLVNQRMKRARWSMRSECPHPQSVGRTVRHGDWSRERSAGRRLTVKSGSKNREFGKNRSTPP